MTAARKEAGWNRYDSASSDAAEWDVATWPPWLMSSFRMSVCPMDIGSPME